MAGRGGVSQRPNGIPREKVCQFKLVLLGEREGREREGGKESRCEMEGGRNGRKEGKVEEGIDDMLVEEWMCVCIHLCVSKSHYAGSIPLLIRTRSLPSFPR